MALSSDGTTFREQLIKGKLTFYCAFLSVVIMAFHVDFLPPVMILWLLIWILENYTGNSFRIFENRSYLSVFLLVIIFFFWQAAGLFYSSDKHMAWLNLFGRLAILLFPLVLVNPAQTIKSRILFLLRVFALCTFLFLIFCLIRATVRSVELVNGHWIFDPIDREYFYENYFFSADLTYKQHPSYIAMFVILSVIISIEAVFDRTIKIVLRTGWLLISICLFCSLYLLSSRAAILTGLIIIPLYIIFKLLKNGNTRLFWLLLLLCLSVGVFGLIRFSKNSPGTVKSILFSEQANNKTTRDPRLIIWKSGFKILENSVFFGVGIGDVRTELTKEYKRIGEKEMEEFRMNAHDQYLETLLESGIIGLTMLLLIIAAMFKIAFSEKNLVYGAFLGMIILMFLFESILYRFAGIAFFSMFSFMLLHLRQEKN